jgi:hypothetical protein
MSGYSANDSYERRRTEKSDIRRHLPRLREAAHGTVLELGVRGGNSTAALLAGVETRGGILWSVDVDSSCGDVFAGHPQWRFVCASSLDEATIHDAGLGEHIDVLFVDTLHTFDHVKAELETWVPKVRTGGRILVHDVESFPEVWSAVEVFARERGMTSERVYRSSGLGILYPGARRWIRMRTAARQPLHDGMAQCRHVAERLVARRLLRSGY